jgi:hypothetical protein
LAQGSINLDDSTITPGVAYAPGNYYSGTYGIQAYELNTAILPGNINPYNGVSSVIAYNNMLADGYALQATFTGQNMINPGTFSLGELKMSAVSPAGSTEAIALVVWMGSGNSLATAPRGGVITFMNPTADYTLTPPPTPPSLTGWGALGQDLVLDAPEPSSLAFVGLSAAALMIFRRRK